MHLLGRHTSAWEYMSELMRATEVPEAEFNEWSRILGLKREIYQDRVSKQPRLPWGSDWYRSCEYELDWSTGMWSCKLPNGVVHDESKL